MNNSDLVSEIEEMRDGLKTSNERYREMSELIYSCDSSFEEQMGSLSENE